MNGQEIHRLRQELGWSMSQFGRHLGVSSGAVSHWESGRNTPDPMRQAAMHKLRERLDQAKAEQRKKDFVEALTAAAVTGGILALLAFIFSESKEQ